MVLTRSQIENLTREELTEELLQISDVSCQLKALNDRFDIFAAKHEKLKSDLLITNNCNTLLHQRIIQLERSAVNNAQYPRIESLEVNPVPLDIGDNVLEETVCRAISLTRNEVTPDDLHACRGLKNKDRVILKFKDRKLKRSIEINRKVLQQKSLELSQLKFSGKLFISESMCYGNERLAYKCRQRKNSKKIYSTWLWNNVVNIKVTHNGEIHQIFHTTDIENI